MGTTHIGRNHWLSARERLLIRSAYLARVALNSEELRAVAEKESLEYAAEYDVTKDKGFLIWATSLVFRLQEEDAFQAATIGGKNDIGLDFGFIDRPDQKIILAQGKFTESIGRPDIRSIATLPSLLEDPRELRQREANEKVLDFARDYRAAKRDGFSTTLYLVHLGELTPAIRGELGVIVDVDSRRLIEAHESSMEVSFAPPPAYIDLDIERNMFFRLEDRPNHARCFVTRVPLTELNKIYRTHREGLLDRNIRLHAGRTTPANKGMGNTLARDKEPENFFYYNNGLCILCAKIDKPQDTLTGVRIRLHEPQIVNGGQTYHTVGTLDEDLLDAGFVLARIISPPGGASEAFVQNVIRFNNTQTPVTSRDFHANDPIQKRLVDKFSKFETPWFYERKLGLWEALPDKERARFRRDAGRARSHFRIIDSEKLAQCRLAWEGRPAIAKTQTRLIFEEDRAANGLYLDVFGDGCDSDDSIKELLLCYKLNEMLVAQRKKWAAEKREAQEQNDKEKLRRLEELGFIPFFNFFALASMRHIHQTYYPATRIELLLETHNFQKLYEFIISVFKIQLKADQRAAETAGRTLDVANWFKSDKNFDNVIKPGCDAMHDMLPDSLVGGPHPA